MFDSKEYKRQFYLKNRDKYNAEAKQRYEENKDWIKEQRKLKREERKNNPEEYQKFLQYQRDYRVSHTDERKIYDAQIQNRYKHYQVSARRREYVFTLTYEEFETIYNANCIYCWDIANWVDRLDNSIWYTTENSAPCCWFCNKMKLTHDKSSFLEQIKKIYLNNL